MAKYSYKLVSKRGKISVGTVSALTKGMAQRKISKGGAIVVYISAAEKNIFQKALMAMNRSFSAQEKINFFRNVSMMISSGLSIVEALDISAENIKNAGAKHAIKTMAENTKNGRKFSKTMSQYPNYFPQVIVETVNMGEVSGKLSRCLDRIAIDMEKNEETKRRILSAMLYPFIIIFAMFVVLFLLLFDLLPEISKVYSSLDVELPASTGILLDAGNFMKSNVYMIATAACLAILAFYLLLKVRKIRYYFDYSTLRFPIFGDLIKDYNLVLFFRSIEALLSSGVSLVDSVNIARKTVTNLAYAEAFKDAYPILLRGVHFSDALMRHPFLFNNQTIKIVEVGEKTGKFEKSFSRIVEYYENTFEYKTRTLTTLIEPIMMLVLGGIVGGVAISVFLPIYSLVNAF